MRRFGTPSCLIAAALSVVLAPIRLGAEAAPSATQPASTQPAADIRLNFRDSPLDVVLKHLSEAAGFLVVADVPIDARVTVVSVDPVTPEQAVLTLDTALKSNGYAAIRVGKTLHITSRDKAKKSNVPVFFGSDPDQIADTDQIITQVLPIRSVDAVKLRDDLRPLIGPDADVAANGGSNAMIITDNSSNIRRIAQIISVLDKREAQASTYRVIQLKNASASAAAKLVLTIFHPEEPERAQRQQQPNQPPPPREERAALGNGVDQALHGGRVTAAADDRTNTVVVAGPTATITVIEDMLKSLDANPATVVTIKSFHLKVADADEVSRLITDVFSGEPGGNQIRGVGGDSPVRTRISAVPELRTNTIVVTAPQSVMEVIQTLITELEANPGGDGQIKSFHLKYADATAVGTALESALDMGGARRRRGPGALERVAVTPDPRTNTIIVSGPTESLREAEKLINNLDTNPTEGSQVRFFHLQMADAGTAAKLISGFFDPNDTSHRGAAGTANVGVNAQADDRSNTVVVHAPADAMKTVEQIIKEIEQQPWLSYDIHTYPLTYADADATAKLITSIFTPDPSSGQAPKNQPLRTVVIASADTRTNSVVVTAPQESLKVIDSLVKMLDANPGTSSDMKVFQLQYADAESAAKLIENMFPQPGQLASAGGARGGGPALSGPGTQILLHMPLVITSADDRTNTLVVTAPADILKVVETLVHQLDSNPASKQTFFIYRLRNGQSADMAYVLNQLFGNMNNGSQQRPSSTSSQQPFGGLSSGLGGGRSSGLGSGTGGLGSGLGANSNRNNSSSLTGGSGTTPSSAAVSPGAAQMANALAGQVYVVADPNTNALLVTTASRFESQVRQIIAELDRSVPQVLIKVLVAEVTHDNSVDFGTDFSVLNTRPNGNGQSAGQTFGNPGTGLVVNFLENNLNAQLHALAQQNKLDVLSRPYILASDNQPASILVGQQVPIVNSNYTTALGQTVSNYTYESVGIILNVTPHINPDGLVTLDVAPEISQLTAQTVSVGPGVNAPIIADRSATSRVGIRDGNTIVIGGLMQDQKTLTVNKIPIIGDIPLIGALFSRTQVDKTKTELLIFLTPHVAQQPDVLGSMSQDEVNGTKLTPNAVSPGMMQEHLQGMQRGGRSQTQPASQPTPSVMEFKPGTDSNYQTPTQTIPLPIR